MNYRSKVILLAILLLIKACSGFFEWVHPEEWQQREPQVEEEKPSIGERLKEKAEETSQAVKEKAYEWKESIKETGKAIKEGIGQVGDEYGQEMSDTYHNIQKYLNPKSEHVSADLMVIF